MPKKKKRKIIKDKPQKNHTIQINPIDNELTRKLKELDPNLPPEKINKLSKTVSQVVVKEHVGILPPPEVLALYGEVVPDFPDRIVKMAEKQASHRQKQENRIILSDIISSYIGQLFAFIIVITAIGGGIFLIYSGKDATGLTTIIGAIIGAASVFIIGKKKAEQDITKAQQNLKKRFSNR